MWKQENKVFQRKAYNCFDYLLFMKICILTTSFPAFKGDIQSPFIFNHAKALVGNGLDVMVICPYYKKSKSLNENYDNIKIFRFKYFFTKIQTLTDIGSIPDAIKSLYGKFQLPFFSLFFLFKAIFVARRSDIIHAQWIVPSGLIGVLIKKLYNKPLICTTRGSDLSLSKRGFFNLLLKYVLKNCDYVASNNVEHVKIIKSLNFIDKNRIFYIPNGLDYGLYKIRDKNKIRNKLGLSKKDKIILFVGYLIKRKRIDILIRAFLRIYKKHKNLKLIIIGSGPLNEKHKSLVNNLDLSNSINFLGTLPAEKVAFFMSAADVFVLSSESEGRPNVVLEAMASGLPVVVTDVGDIKSFIVNGRDGFIVKVNDVDSLASRIGSLLDNRNISKQFSENGFKVVRRTNPTWKVAGRLYKSLYVKLKHKL